MQADNKYAKLFMPISKNRGPVAGQSPIHSPSFFFCLGSQIEIFGEAPSDL